MYIQLQSASRLRTVANADSNPTAAFFNEAAREAAATAVKRSRWFAGSRYVPPEDEAADVLNAALEALPERSKRFLALAALSEDELLERVMAGLVAVWPEHMTAPTGSGLQWGQLVATSTFTALGLPVAEREATG